MRVATEIPETSTAEITSACDESDVRAIENPKVIVAKTQSFISPQVVATFEGKTETCCCREEFKRLSCTSLLLLRILSLDFEKKGGNLRTALIGTIQRMRVLLLFPLLFLTGLLLGEVENSLFTYEDNLEELESINKLLEQLKKRKAILERNLNLPQDQIGLFDSAFIPVFSLAYNESIISADVLRVIKRNKNGVELFLVTLKSNGEVLIFENDKNVPSFSFSVLEASTCTTEDSPRFFDIRTGIGGNRFFIATLQETGEVRIHGLSIKRFDLERNGYWKEDLASQSTEWKSQSSIISVHPSVYIHQNASVTAFDVYSTVQRSLLILGTDKGQVDVIDPNFPRSFSRLFEAGSSPIKHISIFGNNLLAATEDGKIQFAILGSNKVISNSLCTFPPLVGSIKDLPWLFLGDDSIICHCH